MSVLHNILQIVQIVSALGMIGLIVSGLHEHGHAAGHAPTQDHAHEPAPAEPAAAKRIPAAVIFSR